MYLHNKCTGSDVRTSLRIVVQVALAKGLEVDPFNAFDNSLLAASLFNNLSNTLNRFKVFSINVDQTTRTGVDVVLLNVARKADFNVLNNAATLNLGVELHLWKVGGLNHDNTNLLVIRVYDCKFISLSDSFDCKGKAVWVAVGPEVVFVKVKRFPREGQASSVAEANGFQSSRFTIEQELVCAQVAYEITETGCNTTVQLKTCKKETKLKTEYWGPKQYGS